MRLYPPTTFHCKGLTSYRCCKTNACGITATCPSGDLVPALMDRPEQFNAYTSPSSSSTPSPPPEGKSSKGAIIGGAVGGAVVFALIIGVIIFLLCRRKKRKQKESKVEVEGGANATTPMIKSKGEHLRLSEQYNTQTRTTVLQNHAPLTDSIFSAANLYLTESKLFPVRLPG